MLRHKGLIKFWPLNWFMKFKTVLQMYARSEYLIAWIWITKLRSQEHGFKNPNS